MPSSKHTADAKHSSIKKKTKSQVKQQLNSGMFAQNRRPGLHAQYCQTNTQKIHHIKAVILTVLDNYSKFR